MPQPLEPARPRNRTADAAQLELIAARREAVARAPEDVSALCALAGALMEVGRWGEAAKYFLRANALAPQLEQIRKPMARIASALVESADAHRTHGDSDSAISEYRRAIELDSGVPPEAYLKLGTLLIRNKQPDQALAVWSQASARYPACVPAYMNMGSVLRKQSRNEEAIAAYRQAVQADPNSIAAYRCLGDLLGRAGRIDEALEVCLRIRELAPDDSHSVINVANVLEHQGKVREAHDLLLPLLQSGQSMARLALVYGRVCQHLEPPSDAALPLLIDQLGRAGHPDETRSEILTRLSGLCDALARYDEAFSYLQQAKKIGAERFDDSSEELLGVIARSLEIFTPQRMAQLPRARHGSQQPIFIVGMPRSGTSLAEQILSSHPQVYGAGELTFIIGLARSALGLRQGYPECLEAWTQQRVDSAAEYYLTKLRELAPSAARVTDKMPFNFLHLGMIEVLFPQARIIHCSRNPLDTCVSCYFMEFSQNLSIFNNLTTTGKYYKGYRELMQHWRGVIKLPIFELRYESLLAAPETTVRSLVDFCGLAWDDACMKFHESKRHTKTFSYQQVRKPLYNKSVGRYRNYARHLGPLMQALGPEITRECEAEA